MHRHIGSPPGQVPISSPHTAIANQARSAGQGALRQILVPILGGEPDPVPHGGQHHRIQQDREPRFHGGVVRARAPRPIEPRSPLSDKSLQNFRERNRLGGRDPNIRSCRPATAAQWHCAAPSTPAQRCCGKSPPGPASRPSSDRSGSGCLCCRATQASLPVTVQVPRFRAEAPSSGRVDRPRVLGRRRVRAPQPQVGVVQRPRPRSAPGK